MTNLTEPPHGWNAQEDMSDQAVADVTNPNVTSPTTETGPADGASGQDRRRRSASLFARSLMERVRQGVRRFPVVVALTGISTLIEILFLYDVLGSYYNLSEEAAKLALPVLLRDFSLACLLGVPLAVAAQLAGERTGKDARRSRLMQAIAAVVAVIIFMALAVGGRLLDRVPLCTMMAAGIGCAGTLLVPWLLMDDRNERTLVPRLVSMGLYAAWLVGVLSIGLCICILASEMLVFGTQVLTDRLYGVTFLLCWAFLFPNLLCSQLPHLGDELRVSRAYHGVVGQAIFPLCLLLLAVLYAYIAKIVVLRHMPSGEMNWFGSFALLIWACLWLGLRDWHTRPVRWFIRWGWALLVPVVVVQLVGVGIRLHAYGLTPLRCASLACIGVGIAGLVIAALGRPPRQLFLVAAVVCLVVTVSPANIVDMANLNQTMRLRATLSELGLIGDDGLVVGGRQKVVTVTEDQREQLTGAWFYLRTAERGYRSDALVDDLRVRSANESFEQLFGFSYAETDGDGWRDDTGDAGPVQHRFEFLSADAATDVDGYTQAYNLYDADGSTWLSVSEDYRLLLFWDDGTELDVKLSELVEGLMKSPPAIGPDDYSAARTLPASELRVELGDGRVLALQQVRVEMEDGEVSEVFVDGLLLVR